ncbi:FecR domain-containing protein [Tamlana sp. 2201CG12-4]|uniref:FecR family protein n=1 Tax=Tamlana sp. 2201CG12-4 TaxID=3112582 RepID=UPI002DBA4B7F|nr:FecR domain-containing protein [Tamlana sp. 2201CG12-4]MEC3905812.1 FecR domain-containing protein [Tamlana sp. 2201CG12-4]
MKRPEIDKIIVKFLNKEASLTDLETLEDYLKNQKDTSVFNRFVEVEFLTAHSMGQYNLHEAKELINKRLIEINRKRKIKFFKKIAVAASILLVMGLSYIQWSDTFKNNVEEVNAKSNHAVEPGTNKAILTFENGDQISLEKDKSFQKENISVEGHKIVYTQKGDIASPEKKIAYNYLTIPRGGQYFVVLADGTKVWLNSESKLKFPVAFIDGEPRHVELLYGEAYFEVSPSSKHRGANFNVLTMNQNVDVLGTEFNIKAYKDDREITTTLVGGKIVIQKGDAKKEIKPNQQSKINHDSDIINIVEVDASQEISWINGLFTFSEANLYDMMKELARWYDAEVIFENADKKQFVFTGVLERTKTIDEILQIIEATSEGEIVFEIKKKTITIK